MQAPAVLDDPLLHHRHPTRAIEMGVGVVLLRPAVRRPARMAYPAQPCSTSCRSPFTVVMPAKS